MDGARCASALPAVTSSALAINAAVAARSTFRCPSKLALSSSDGPFDTLMSGSTTKLYAILCEERKFRLRSSQSQVDRVTIVVNVGIVGLSASGGWAARAHVPALAAVEGLELRGLTASSAASARAASDAFGVPAYPSVRELAQAVDLVLVAVKVPRHRELILPALELGVPVLSEWPLGLDLREAEELERAARGTRTFVGLQGRSSPTFRWLADLVADGSIGE